MSTKPDIECDLCDLVNMAHIAATLLEINLGNKKRHEQITGSQNTYYLSEDDAGAMIFAGYEVHNRLRDLRDKYLDSLGLKD
jgi:hypothetical protein